MVKVRGWFGSVFNRIDEAQKQPEPKEGDGCTMISYTDRYAGTVVKVLEFVIAVQEDRAIRTDKNGMSECQYYEFQRNPEARVVHFKKDRNGRYREAYVSSKNRWCFKNSGLGLRIGDRDAYHDYTF